MRQRTLVVSACAYLPSSGELDRCGGGDKRPWTLTEEPPGNAEELRQLVKPKWTRKYAGEAWFTLPTGEVMLCRLERYSVEWWKFEPSEEGPALVEHDGDKIIVAY